MAFYSKLCFFNLIIREDKSVCNVIELFGINIFNNEAKAVRSFNYLNSTNCSEF